MRAWQVSQLGNPIDVLELNEVDEISDPIEGHIQVSIQSVGISFPDVLQCRGEYQVKPALPWTLEVKVQALLQKSVTVLPILNLEIE